VKIKCAITLLCLLTGIVIATEAFLFGIHPGETVALPELMTVQGERIATDSASVVIFTMVENCQACERLHLIAESWQQRYPQLQILLVDTRNGSEVILDWQQSVQTTVPLIDDAEDVFLELFATNRVPVMYLLDEAGKVQDKQLGGNLAGLLRFDDSLYAANEGDWAAVSANALTPLIEGELAAPLAGINFSGAETTVIVHHNPNVAMSQQLVEDDLLDTLNRLAKQFPEVHFIVLQPESGLDADIALYDAFISRFGEAAMPEETILQLRRLQSNPADAKQAAAAAEASHYTLAADSGWQDTVAVITYERGSTGDPTIVWGRDFTPGLTILGAAGEYLGPEPFWSGPYTSAALESFLIAQLDEITATP
jgi:hypothetical protein